MCNVAMNILYSMKYIRNLDSANQKGITMTNSNLMIIIVIIVYCEDTWSLPSSFLQRSHNRWMHYFTRWSKSHIIVNHLTESIWHCTRWYPTWGCWYRSLSTWRPGWSTWWLRGLTRGLGCSTRRLGLLSNRLCRASWRLSLSVRRFWSLFRGVRQSAWWLG